MTNWLLGGAAVAALTVAGCSSGATIHSTITSAAPFCKDLQGFATQVEGLSNAANEPLSTLTPQVGAVYQSLAKLQSEAPSADTVNGHLVKADLATEASAFGALSGALASASTTDPNAAGNALDAVNAKYGGALTDATNRLDDYAHPVCGVTVTAPNPTTTTTTSGTSPVGPTAPPQTSTAP
jgi:hypothetical protein